VSHSKSIKSSDVENSNRNQNLHLEVDKDIKVLDEFDHDCEDIKSNCNTEIAYQLLYINSIEDLTKLTSKPESVYKEDYQIKMALFAFILSTLSFVLGTFLDGCKNYRECSENEDWRSLESI